MKRRTFRSTLGLFLLFIFLGITTLSIISLQSMISRGKNRVLDEHYFITASLIKDFSAVKERGGALENSAAALASPYSHLSGDQKTELSFFKGESHLFSSGFGLRPSSEYSLQEGFRHMEIQKVDGNYHIIVDGYFPQPYESYRLLYGYNLTGDIGEWWKTVGTLFIVGSLLSVVLAFLLLFLIERLFHPLLRLSNASKSVSSGTYDVRLPLGGGEELDDLAASFNTMAETIGKQIETLNEAVDSRQQFIDNFSHEMRTPLTAIYGYAEYLQITEVNEEETFSALSNIMLQSNRLQALSSQLLELAGLGGGSMQWDKVQLSDLLQKVSRTLETGLHQNKIELIITNNADYICGDEVLLRILFTNLLENAIHASYKESEIKLTAIGDNEKVIVTLEDFGKGIDEKHLAHITEPFYRGDSARSRQEGGTGLGLSICAEIAKRHHAKLTFASVVNKGTKVMLSFTTSLPPDDKTQTPLSYTLGNG